MKLENIIYDVLESLKQYTGDSELDPRYIIYLYNIKRAKYLRQELNNYQRTTDITVTQTLCLGLEKVPIEQCGVNYTCETILRTKRPIPKPIELHTKSAITVVRPTTKVSIPFNFISKEKAVYSMYSPYNKGIYAFLDNDLHIYLVSNLNTLDLIDCLTITGIFEDPLDLVNYQNCCNCDIVSTCFDEYSSDYPLQPHYIDLIKNEIVKELVAKINLPEDNQNNSNDDN